jgi:hypothetical protein
VVNLTRKLFKVWELMAWPNRCHGLTHLLLGDPVPKPFLYITLSSASFLTQKLQCCKTNFPTSSQEENLFIHLIFNFIRSVIHVLNL